jgi:hypothetical protein
VKFARILDQAHGPTVNNAVTIMFDDSILMLSNSLIGDTNKLAEYRRSSARGDADATRARASVPPVKFPD